ncbi:MAG TPA: hypothetical protein VJ436_06560 [Anaerolineales bacterium]|nr:hypothetical protein [Anaerolineales bacterium]
MNNPLMVEIIAYAPTAFYHCTHCEVAWREAGVTNRIHTEQVTSSLPPDLAEEYQILSDWVRNMAKRYCDQLLIKVVDAASLEGFFKTLRYRVRRFPAVIVAGETRFLDGDFQAAGEEIERRLAAITPIHT